jgi:hypothetical protein
MNEQSLPSRNRITSSSVKMSHSKTEGIKINNLWEIKRQAKKDLELFKSLKSIDSETINSLVRQVRKHLIVLAFRPNKITEFTDYLSNSGGKLMLIILMPILIALPIFTNYWTNLGFQIEIWMRVYFLYIITSFALYFLPGILALLILRISRPKDYPAIVFFFFITVIYIFLLRWLVSAVNGQMNFYEFALINALCAFLLFVLFILVLLLSWVMIVYFVNVYWDRKYPDSIIVGKLIDLLYKAESGSTCWADFDYKRDLISDVVDIATRTQNYLPRRLKINDYNTDMWLKNSSKQIAHAIRGTSKLVFTSHRDQFIEIISEALEIFAAGNWENLEKWEISEKDERELPFRSKIFVRITNFIKKLIAGGVPLVLFLLLQQTIYALESPFSEYFLIGSIIWLLLTFLSMIDPLYKDKLSALKDIKNFIPSDILE